MTKFHKILIFVLLLSVSNVWGQGLMQLRNKNKVKIPFEYLHNLIIIPVEINGTPLHFILDTGSTHTFIFTLEQNDSLTLNHPKNIKIRGLGSNEPIDAIFSENNQIKIQNIVGFNQNVYLVMVEKFDLSARVGKTIHGIIGNELLKNFVVTIDYHNKTLVFEKPDQFKSPSSKKFSEHLLTFHQNKPYIKGLIQTIESSNPTEVLMLIDSGNSDALWLFEDLSKNISSPHSYYIDHLGEGFSGKIEGKRTKLHQFQLRDFLFKKPTVAFLDSVTTQYASMYEDRNGSIGSQILNRFKVILDYPHQKMYLKKTGDFDKEFRYNRSGIELYYYGKTLVKNERTKQDKSYGSNQDNVVNFIIDYQYEFKPLYAIYHIQEQSPAALAGLRKNDIVLKINNKNTMDYSIEELQVAFYGDEGKKINLLIERNGAKMSFEFLLKEKL